MLHRHRGPGRHRPAAPALRVPLLHPVAADRRRRPVLQEEEAYPGHPLCQRDLPDIRHRRAAVPHEQRALPAGGGLRPHRLLPAHRSAVAHPSQGRRRGAGRGHHPLPPLHPALPRVPDRLQDHLLGRRQHLHGAPVRHPKGQLRARHRRVPAEADRLQRRGDHDGPAGQARAQDGDPHDGGVQPQRRHRDGARGQGQQDAYRGAGPGQAQRAALQARAPAGGGQVAGEQRDLQRQPEERLLREQPATPPPRASRCEARPPFSHLRLCFAFSSGAERSAGTDQMLC